MNKALIFAGGLVAGGIAGYLIARIQYKKEIDILNKELDESVEKEFKKRFKKSEPKKEDKDDALTDAEQRAFKEKMERYSGTSDDFEEEFEELEEGPVEIAEKPYVITYDEYANEHIADFDKRTLTYFEQDDILVNDEHEILNIDFYIGREALNHVGDEETDTVHVRNEKNCVDYEVQVTHVKFREE